MNYRLESWEMSPAPSWPSLQRRKMTESFSPVAPGMNWSRTAPWKISGRSLSTVSIFPVQPGRKIRKSNIKDKMETQTDSFVFLSLFLISNYCTFFEESCQRIPDRNFNFVRKLNLKFQTGQKWCWGERTGRSWLCSAPERISPSSVPSSPVLSTTPLSGPNRSLPECFLDFD